MLLFKKCCFCVDLRVGSFIIGYFSLFLRILLLIMASMQQAVNSKQHHPTELDYAFDHLTNVIGIMILAFEILLCFALVIGLHKRLDQHLEMFYVGSFFFMVLGLILFSAIMLRYKDRFGPLGWAIVAVEVVLKIICIYSLAVIRCYYYQMKEEAKGDVEALYAGEAVKPYFARTRLELPSLKA